jgi:hypothetical protein
MKELRIILILVGIFYFSCPSFAQVAGGDSTAKTPFKDRLFVGGSLGLSFGDYTFVEVAPIVGYKITDALSAGIGGRYSYVNVNDSYYGISYSYSSYGGSLFSRYIVYKGIFLAAEFEANNFQVYKLVDPINGVFTSGRAWIPSLLLGGGYMQNAGGKASVFLSLLYDVLQDRNSPYYRIPVIRGGVMIGL